MNRKPSRLLFPLSLMLIFAALFNLSCSKRPANLSENTDKTTEIKTRVHRPIQPDVAATDVDGDPAQLDIDSLVQLLGDRQYERRVEAAEQLSAKGADAVAAVESGLESDNYHVRAGCAFALGQFGDATGSAVEKLRKLAAEDPREAVRAAAAFAIDSIESDG